MNKTKKIAFAGILTALCIVMLLFGSFFSVIDLSCSALAGMILIIAVIEMGDKVAWGVFFASSILGYLIIPVKLTAFFFMFFVGWYPIAKKTFERLHPVLSWTVKMSTFNVCLAVMICFFKFVLNLPTTDFDFTWALFGLGNLTFVIYDIALSKLILLYIVKIRKILKLNKLF